MSWGHDVIPLPKENFMSLLSYRYLAPASSLADSAYIPLILDSPHSGTEYPPDFGAAIDIAALRTAEDTWVADLWDTAPELGVALLAARFPRSYIDANRGLEEIDPLLLEQPWPQPLPESAKVRLGKGLIWRMMDDGTALYQRSLSHEEVRWRIAQCWQPYHDRLQALVDQAHAQFGQVWHINCHSMPSVAGAYATDQPGLHHPDFVLGDRDGSTAAPEFHEFIAQFLRGVGYSVSINDPYKGVEIVRRYGDPAHGRHSLQIEINRRLYMDEHSLRPNAGFAPLRQHLKELMLALRDWIGTRL